MMDILSKLKIKNEILKRLDLIEDYTVNVDTENYEINKDGAIRFDVVIRQNIIPKIPTTYIDLNITLGNNGSINIKK